MNVTLNATDVAVLALLKSNPNLTRIELSERISKTVRTVQRALDSLKEKGYITRIGSKKDQVLKNTLSIHLDASGRVFGKQYLKTIKE